MSATEGTRARQEGPVQACPPTQPVRLSQALCRHPAQRSQCAKIAQPGATIEVVIQGPGVCGCRCVNSLRSAGPGAGDRTARVGPRFGQCRASVKGVVVCGFGIPRGVAPELARAVGRWRPAMLDLLRPQTTRRQNPHPGHAVPGTAPAECPLGMLRDGAAHSSAVVGHVNAAAAAAAAVAAPG